MAIKRLMSKNFLLIFFSFSSFLISDYFCLILIWKFEFLFIKPRHLSFPLVLSHCLQIFLLFLYLIVFFYSQGSCFTCRSRQKIQWVVEYKDHVFQLGLVSIDVTIIPIRTLSQPNPEFQSSSGNCLWFVWDLVICTWPSLEKYWFF